MFGRHKKYYKGIVYLFIAMFIVTFSFDSIIAKAAPVNYTQLGISKISEKRLKKVPKVRAKAYIVTDALTGEVIIEKNADIMIYPASTAKLMTAVVAAENSSLNKVVKIKSSVLNHVAYDASKVGLVPGMEYSMNEMLHIMLIPSGADAADSIAVAVSGKLRRFIRKMNEKASELGMNNSSFDNTIGLDIGNNYNNIYSTARDMALLAHYVMDDEYLRSIVKTPSYSYYKNINNEIAEVKNTNWFINRNYSSNFTSENYQIIGTKTGTTNAAGKCLIATAKDSKGHEVTISVFGAADRGELYYDVAELFDFVFEEISEDRLMVGRAFADTRFLPEHELISRYAAEGFLTANKQERFEPNSNAKQVWFYELLDKAAGTDLLQELPKEQRTKIINPVQLASFLYEYYPYEISKKQLNKISSNFVYKKELSEEDMTKLAVLYQSGILPKEFSYRVEKAFTKTELLVIADHIRTLILDEVLVPEEPAEPTEPVVPTEAVEPTDPIVPTETVEPTEAVEP